MFCKNCGSALPEEQIRFCPNCGTEQPLEAAPAKEPSSAPTAEPAPVCDPALAAEHTVVEEPASAFASPDEAAFGYEKPKKKKKGLFLGLGIGLGVIAAVAAAVLLFSEQLLGLYYRNFASPEEYFAYVEAKHLEKQLKSFATAYQENTEGLGDSFTLSASMGFTLGEELLSLMEEEGGASEEEARSLVEWLNRLKLDLVTKQDGKLSSMEYTLSREEEAIAGLLVLMDQSEGDLYLSLPGLDERFQKNEGTKALDEERLKELLPDGALVERVMKRYQALLFESLPDFSVKQGSYPAESGDIEAYLISVTVTSEDLDALLEAMLEEAEGDEELEEIYDCMIDLAVEMGFEKELFPAYDALFEDAEDEEIEDHEASREELAEEVDEKMTLTLTDYVNGKNELIGRSLLFDDEVEAMELRWFNDGEQIDFFFGNEENSLVAFGTIGESKTQVEGELRAPDAGFELSFVWTEEGDSKNGTVSLQAELVPPEGELPYEKIKLDYTCTSKEREDHLVLSVSGDDKKLIDMTLDCALTEGAKITLPEEEQLLQEGEEWMEDFDQEDLEALIEKLQLPDVILRGTPYDPNQMTVQTQFVAIVNGSVYPLYEDTLDVFPAADAVTVLDVADAAADLLGGEYSDDYKQYTAFADLEEENGYYWYAYVDGERVTSWNQVIDEDSVVEFRYELP